MADKYVNATGLRAAIDWILSTFTKKKDFDALEIGGRNILRGTKFNTISNISPNIGSGVTCDVVNQKDSSSPSGYSLMIKRTDSTTNFGGRFITMPYKLTNGKVYTWNFYAKGSGSWIIGNEQNGLKKVTLTSDYVRYNHTFTANDNDTYQFIFYNTKNANITICGVKLEVGNKATDWSPAPEDVETAISDVNNDCIKGLSVSDKTITYTKGDGSKGTITTQDTNTWRGIQNNLTSDSTTDSLAAAQGKALKALVDGKAASSHKHAKSDITDMPTSLPANGGNADTVDGKHASDIFKHLSLKDAGEISANTRGCFNLNLVGTSLGWLNVAQFDQGHFITQLGMPCWNDTNAKELYIRTRYTNFDFDDWNTGWKKVGIDVIIGTSSGTVAYRSEFTKAVVEFWKTTVGSASRTVYDAVLINGLSSSMTAFAPLTISSGQDFAFAIGNDASGGIIISGNFSKYKITYFN